MFARNIFQIVFLNWVIVAAILKLNSIQNLRATNINCEEVSCPVEPL